MSFKKTMLMSAAVAVTTAGVVGLGAASAATDSGERMGLADKIATNLNLDKGEVKAILNEERVLHKADMEEKFEKRLDAAVAEGKLTEEQKAKIIAKHAEMREQMEADREAFKGKTKEEMRTALLDRHEAQKQWAEENGIPMEYMMMGPGMVVRGHSDAPTSGTGAQPTFEVHFEGPNE